MLLFLFSFLPEIHCIFSHTFTLSEDPEVSLSSNDSYRFINAFWKVELGAVDNVTVLLSKQT